MELENINKFIKLVKIAKKGNYDITFKNSNILINDMDITNVSFLKLDLNINTGLNLNKEWVFYYNNIKDFYKQINVFNASKLNKNILINFNDYNILTLNFYINNDLFLNIDLREKDFYKPIEYDPEYKGFELQNIKELFNGLNLKSNVEFNLKSNYLKINIGTLNILENKETNKSIHYDILNKYSYEYLKIVKSIYSLLNKECLYFDIGRDTPIKIYNKNKSFIFLLAPMVSTD